MCSDHASISVGPTGIYEPSGYVRGTSSVSGIGTGSSILFCSSFDSHGSSSWIMPITSFAIPQFRMVIPSSPHGWIMAYISLLLPPANWSIITRDWVGSRMYSSWLYGFFRIFDGGSNIIIAARSGESITRLVELPTRSITKSCTAVTRSFVIRFL